MSQVEALFVESDGIYPHLLGKEHCWDISRDARGYLGPGPVVAHPPCHLWVSLAAVNWKRWGSRLPAWYEGGSDAGCFDSALQSVRLYGGVLEHPGLSHAWKHYGLTKPTWKGWRKTGENEYTCEVWQSAYGHRARKKTWLLYCGSNPPFELNWERKAGSHVIGGGINTGFSQGRPKMQKKEANASPTDFAKTLIKLAEHSKNEPS